MIINPFRFLKNLLLDLYPATAAYSLSKLSAVYTGSAVNVRRGSDNTTLDIGFNGVDLDVASLEAFCQPNTIAYQLDASAGNENLQEVRGSGSDGETVAGVSDCYKFTIDNTLGSHQAFRAGLEEGQTFTMTFDYYIPSTNTDITGILVTRTNPGPTTVFNVTDQWTSVSVTLVDESFFRFFAHNGTTTNFTGNSTDVFYLKNVVITQLTTNGYITTWYDQSGNGNDAIQTVSSTQPQIVNNGSVSLENGKPIIQDLTAASNMVTSVPLSTQTTVFSVMKNEGTQGILNTFNTTDFVLAALNGNSTSAYGGGITNVTSYLNGSAFTFTNRDVAWDNTTNQSLVSFYFNQSLTSLSYLGWNVTGVWSMSSIQTFIIYDSDQSSNRTGIETVLNDYYSIY